MVNRGNQLRARRKTERLISGSGIFLCIASKKSSLISGFPSWADPVTLALEHRNDELYLEISLDETAACTTNLLDNLRRKE